MGDLDKEARELSRLAEATYRISTAPPYCTDCAYGMADFGDPLCSIQGHDTIGYRYVDGRGTCDAFVKEPQ